MEAAIVDVNKVEGGAVANFIHPNKLTHGDRDRNMRVNVKASTSG
jgi:hypothetical protein